MFLGGAAGTSLPGSSNQLWQWLVTFLFDSSKGTPTSLNYWMKIFSDQVLGWGSILAKLARSYYTNQESHLTRHEPRDLASTDRYQE